MNEKLEAIRNNCCGGIEFPGLIQLVLHQFSDGSFCLGKVRKKKKSFIYISVYNNGFGYREFHLLPLASARGLKKMTTRGFSPIRS